MSRSHQERQWREWLYQHSLHKPRADRGTPYPCTQKDLDRCVYLQRSNRNPSIDPMEATYQLTRFNRRRNKTLSHDEDTALKRLEDMLTLQHWEPDIAIKAFKDLDALFFMGRLKGNCKVRWLDAERFFAVQGTLDCYGSTEDLEESGQAKIMLNAELILIKSADPFIEMWRTLLHEMCHAYEMVMSGWHDDLPHDKRVGNIPGHGVHFCTNIQAVHQRAKRLLGLPAIDSLREPYKLDGFDKRHFVDFLAKKAREQERERMFDYYMANTHGQNHCHCHCR